MVRIFPLGAAGLVLAILVGIFLGLSAWTADYAEATSYLSDDPRACVNCHVMREQYDGWQKSLHHATATCNDCHVPHELVGRYLAKMEHGYRHSRGFTFQDFHEPIRITPSSLEIVEDNCRRCHDSMVTELAPHGVPGSASYEPAHCVRCHRGVGHGPAR